MTRLRSLIFNASDFYRETEDLGFTLSQTPLLRNLVELELNNCGVRAAAMAALLAPPGLGALTSFHLAIDLENDHDLVNCGFVAALGRATHITGLRTLTVRSLTLDQSDVLALQTSPVFHPLTSLQMGWIEEPWLEQCPPDSMMLPELRVLDLTGSYLGALDDDDALALHSCKSLASSRMLEHITELVVDGCRLNFMAVPALLRSAHMGRLVKLSLQDLCEGDERARVDAVALEPLRTLQAPALRSFVLAGVCDYRMMRQVSAATVLRHLTELQLPLNGLDDRAIAELVVSPELTGLQAIDLSSNRLGDPACATLANWPHALQLTRLDLSHNWIAVPGLRDLATSHYLENLRQFALEGRREAVASPHRTGDAGALVLSEDTAWTRLVSLRLGDQGVGSARTRGLMASPRLAHLTALYVGTWGQTSDDAELVYREMVGRYGHGCCWVDGYREW